MGEGYINEKIKNLFWIAIFFIFSCEVAYSNSNFIIPDVVEIKSGSFIHGSTREEREYAYQLDEKAYDHSFTRINRWYENESSPTKIDLPSYLITKTPITNRQYQAFVKDTGHDFPFVDEETWKIYRLIHPYIHTLKYLWEKGMPAVDRLDHPVVLVSYEDALAFATWLSQKTGKIWRLPTELEWEKAARGPDGSIFPWGNEFLPSKLNSHDQGPFDTTPVASYPAGASPYGVLDMAGQVFEWTSTEGTKQRQIVKGGSWDDRGCGICRPAARHARQHGMKHILIGFRLVQETN